MNRRKKKTGQKFKAYVYRLYPTADQLKQICCTFGCVRFVHNRMLADRKKAYAETGKGVTPTPATYKADFPFLKKVDSLALANAQLNLNQAYSNFFNNPKHFGKPRFKTKRGQRQSYSTNNQIAANGRGTIEIQNGAIKLPKLGWVKLNQHRPLPEWAAIKTVTVSIRPSGKAYVSVRFADENQAAPVAPRRFLGLDFSMKHLFATSEGEILDFPKYYKQAEAKLRRAQRQLSRRFKGKGKPQSKNYTKQKKIVAKIHEQATAKRHDFLHKQAYRLAEAYDFITVETLAMKSMAKRKQGGRFSFGKSVADNGWGMFVNFLGYKLADRGKTLLKADKFFPSSQLCSDCGTKYTGTKDLAVRDWICLDCGVYHDRDINAAVNLRELGRAQWGRVGVKHFYLPWVTREVTPMESVSDNGRQAVATLDEVGSPPLQPIMIGKWWVCSLAGSSASCD